MYRLLQSVFVSINKLAVVVIVLFVGTVAVLVMQQGYSSVIAQTNSQCPTGFIIQNPDPGQVLTGQVPLEFITSSTATDIDKVRFKVDGNTVGSVSNPETTSPPVWRLDWDSKNYPNGSHDLYATVTYFSQSATLLICDTAPIPIQVNNQTNNFFLELDVSAEVWQGPPNVNYSFSAVTKKITDNGSVTNVTPSTNFIWTTDIGSVTSSGNTAQFFSGPKTGTGEVRVTANYGSRTESFTIDIAVLDPTTNSTYPIPDDDSSSSSGSDDINDEQNDDSNPTTPTLAPSEGDTQALDCITQVFSYVTIEKLRAGERLSFSEFRQIRNCFEERKFVVPRTIVPVDPDQVRTLQEKPTVARIEGARNVQQPSNPDQDTLQFTGYASPNSDVLLYVFSEPLILTAQANDEGYWEYTLENPLEPGDHEAYVVMEDGSDVIRSSSFGFTIAAASASDENPTGLSLALENTASQPLQAYIIAGAAVVLVASFVLARFVWFKKPKTAPAAAAQTVFTPETAQTDDTTPDANLETSLSDDAVDPALAEPTTQPPVEEPVEQAPATGEGTTSAAEQKPQAATTEDQPVVAGEETDESK